ncbi:hypothetical protein PVAP13_6NG138103 [Panicum virgatum]|uniref:Uncharacterized protein n=1 Tax=Panicum virgatum TaxID=38727 RepID=A0A8T0R1G9_PANVG|nr:hypothetical protein PVAP13_6NG138103 [Panicum virgatum]
MIWILCHFYFFLSTKGTLPNFIEILSSSLIHLTDTSWGYRLSAPNRDSVRQKSPGWVQERGF